MKKKKKRNRKTQRKRVVWRRQQFRMHSSNKVSLKKARLRSKQPIKQLTQRDLMGCSCIMILRNSNQLTKMYKFTRKNM